MMDKYDIAEDYLRRHGVTTLDRRHLRELEGILTTDEPNTHQLKVRIIVFCEDKRFEKAHEGYVFADVSDARGFLGEEVLKKGSFFESAIVGYFVDDPSLGIRECKIHEVEFVKKRQSKKLHQLKLFR
jgi:hypothetical protein